MTGIKKLEVFSGTAEELRPELELGEGGLDRNTVKKNEWLMEKNGSASSAYRRCSTKTRFHTLFVSSSPSPR